MLVALTLVAAVPASAGAAGWSHSYTLSSTDLGEPAPRVAVGPEGHVVVAWLRRFGDIRVALGDSHGRFLGSQSLSRTGLRPNVAVGPHGRAIVIWNDKGLKFAIRAPGKTRFGSPRALTTPRGKAEDDQARIVMDSAGRTTVLFEHSFRTTAGYHEVVQALEVAADGTRSPIVSFGEGRLPRRASLAITRAGDTITTFYLNQPPPPAGGGQAAESLVVARRPAGGRWSVRPYPFAADRQIADPSVAVDPDGRTLFSFTDVVLHGEAASFGAPRVSSGPFAGPFGPPVGPSPARPDKAFGPSAVPVNDANVLVWQEKTQARAFSTEAPVRAARIAFDGTVGTPHTLDSSQRAFEPHLVGLGGGRALAVWDRRGIAAALYRTGRGFQRVAAPRGEATFGGTDFNVNRDLAANRSGVAAFTWTQDSRVRISVRRF